MTEQATTIRTGARPLIGVSCCRVQLDHHLFDTAGVKYTDAVAMAADGIPLLLPASGDAALEDDLLDRLDGLLLTGSASNIEPRHYDRDVLPGQELRDPARDATTLPLIRRAVALNLPVLAICRGLQELNVALGGSLHQRLHELADRDDHRANPDLPLETQYGPSHEVALTEGGLLRDLAGASRVTVNSLHEQGIDRLAPGLTVEARSADGGIEAVRASSQGFCVGVQWHPEWQVKENRFSMALFAAFGRACRTFAAARHS